MEIKQVCPYCDGDGRDFSCEHNGSCICLVCGGTGFATAEAIAIAEADAALQAEYQAEARCGA